MSFLIVCRLVGSTQVAQITPQKQLRLLALLRVGFLLCVVCVAVDLSGQAAMTLCQRIVLIHHIQ